MAIKLKTFPEVTVTQAGVRQRLSDTPVLVYDVSVESLSTNTGTQYIGDETVTSSNGHAFGPSDIAIVKPPSGSREPMQFDLMDVFVDSTTNGAKFRILSWIRV